MKLIKGRTIQALDSQVNTEPSLVPKSPFSCYLVSQKGGGKSTCVLNLMLSKDLLAGRFNQVYVICPTNKLDSKWNILKETKGTLSVNYKLLNALKKDKKISIVDNVDGINPEYSTVIPEENFIDVVNSDLLNFLIKEQKHIIETCGKDTADTILLIYDDTISAKKNLVLRKNSTVIKYIKKSVERNHFTFLQLIIKTRRNIVFNPVLNFS